MPGHPLHAARRCPEKCGLVLPAPDRSRPRPHCALLPPVFSSRSNQLCNGTVTRFCVKRDLRAQRARPFVRAKALSRAETSRPSGSAKHRPHSPDPSITSARRGLFGHGTSIKAGANYFKFFQLVIFLPPIQWGKWRSRDDSDPAVV